MRTVTLLSRDGSFKGLADAPPGSEIVQAFG
jgi:hypothetical protein